MILAQDPSFRKLSFSLYNGEDDIYLDSVSFALGDCVGFEKVFNANIKIFKEYTNKLVNFYKVNKDIFVDIIFSEIPPPAGTYSAGLYSLDTYLLTGLLSLNKKCREVYTLPASFLMTIHNSRQFKKSDSTAFARYFMNDILKDRFKFHINGRFNADQAESLLFLLRAFCKYNIKDTRELIINAVPGFYSESEKLLFSRGGRLA